MIATPETGVDSMALTYALLDPIMTVMRPLAAFVTAVCAGVAENFLNDGARGAARVDSLVGRENNAPGGAQRPPLTGTPRPTVIGRVRAGAAFAFNDILADVAGWLVLGILVGGAISALIPQAWIGETLGSGIVAYLWMLAIGLPTYVCATLSTPVAAALITKGLSPGAALVFLMAGPATNAATITMVGGILGKRTLGVYLGSIVVCTLAAGFAVDAIYGWTGVSLNPMTSAGVELAPQWLEWTSAAILGGLVIRTGIIRLKASRLFQGARSGHPRVETDKPSDCACSSPESGKT